MGLRIAQINAQRSRAAAANLELIIKEYDIDILCIQEPYTFKGLVRGYSTQGLSIIQPNRDNTWVAAVIQEKNVEIFHNSNLDTEHVMCFQVCTADDQFYVINVYCQFSLQIEPILCDIEKIIKRLEGHKILLMMD